MKISKIFVADTYWSSKAIFHGIRLQQVTADPMWLHSITHPTQELRQVAIF
jgi:hypothetical protein